VWAVSTFVVLLLEFNKPQQKLVEQIDSQETRHNEMRGRLQQVQQEAEEMSRRMEELDQTWEELEQTRKELLPLANQRLMVQIPAGPFVMGGRDEESPNSERPSHTVYLAAFYIHPFPVTNQDYREFVQVTGHRTPIHWQRGTFPTGLGNHPVTNVTWHDARAYADWSGARLPTEAEWEKAARGTDERPYPWGDRFVEGERCNSNNMVGSTTPVDEFPDGRSPLGLWDMVGNVYEWCSDYYDEEYYKNSPPANPRGPEGGQERVVRGGSFQETRAGLRSTHRAGAAETYNRDNTGFRMAMSSDERPLGRGGGDV
jgi:sulfatase modifying factor 1